MCNGAQQKRLAIGVRVRSDWVVIDRIYVEGNGVGDIISSGAIRDRELNGDLTVEVSRWSEGPTVSGVAGQLALGGVEQGE